MMYFKKYKILITVFLLLLVIAPVSFYLLRQYAYEQKFEDAYRKVPIQNLALSESILKQDYVFVQFFSSWCEACHVQHKKLMDLAKISPFPIVGVAFQDRPDELNVFLKEEGSPYQQVIYDTTGKLALSFGLRGVPETFLIRLSDGSVFDHHLGVFTQKHLDLSVYPLLKILNEDARVDK